MSDALKAEDGSPQTPVILVVEDDEALLKLIRRNLERGGFCTEGVVTGREAIDGIVNNPPDLLLLDYLLPDMTGQEVVAGLKARQCEVPFIVGTGRGDEVAAVEMMKMGARDYLVKDASYLERLPRTIRLILEQISMEKRTAEAEKALRTSEEKFRTIFHSANDEIIVLDKEGTVVDRNVKGENILGYTFEEVAGKRIGELNYILPDNQLPRMAELFSSAMGGTGGRGFAELEMPHKNGSMVSVQASISPIEIAGQREGIIVVLRDISERKRAEGELRQAHAQLQEAMEQLKASQEQLIQSEKLAAIGQLVSGVAHELNNPLMAISGYSEILMNMPDEQAAASYIQNLHKETGRAISIIQNLLSFARKQEPRKKPTSINSIVDSVIKLRSYKPGMDNIGVELYPAEDLPKAMVDFHQMQQVFVNLLINAEQALKRLNGEGKVSIYTRQVNGAIEIDFSDNGPGIPEDIQGKIFDPFFTTREVGQGTGLGLSICYGIIQEHGGEISVQSTEGGGTTFTIRLPGINTSLSSAADST
ncbi:MAG: PAS domain S-box protein [Dehalococcoidia bacterium]